MKTKNTQNYVQVKYDLLATKRLNSTQKLFISYIIGWQNNKLVCKETNNNLAIRFGMKYSGIRTLLSDLNKYDFFKSVRIDFDKKNNTSGHEIKVDEKKLEEFLSLEKTTLETISTEEEPIENESLDELEILPTEQLESQTITKYQDEDIINIQDLMTILDFNENDIISFKNLFDSNSVKFEDFEYKFYARYMGQRLMPHDGIIISSEQYQKLSEMTFSYE